MDTVNRRDWRRFGGCEPLGFNEDTVSVREILTSWSVSILNMVKPGLTGSSMGEETGWWKFPAVLEFQFFSLWVWHSLGNQGIPRCGTVTAVITVLCCSELTALVFPASFSKYLDHLGGKPHQQTLFLLLRVWPSVPHLGPFLDIVSSVSLRSLDLGSRGSDGWCPLQTSHPPGKNTPVAFRFLGEHSVVTSLNQRRRKKNLVPDKLIQKCAGRKSESNTTSNEPIIRGSWQSKGKQMQMKSRSWELFKI